MSRWTSFFAWAWPSPCAELAEKAERLVAVERSAPAVEPVLEGAPLDVLHDDEGAVLLLADVEDLNDVRMVEPGGEAGLAREPLPHLVVAGEVVGEELDGDFAIELQVAGAVDGRHAAVAEPVLELVALTGELALHPSPLSFAWPGGTNPPWPECPPWSEWPPFSPFP